MCVFAQYGAVRYGPCAVDLVMVSFFPWCPFFCLVPVLLIWFIVSFFPGVLFSASLSSKRPLLIP